MATRKRDYKAEYARAKARANAAGYKSQREYKRARKGLPTRSSPIPQPIRNRIRDAEAREWSKQHARMPSAKFSTKWGRERRDLYYETFVEPSKSGNKSSNDREDAQWRRNLKKLLVPKVYSLEEFNERYRG